MVGKYFFLKKYQENDLAESLEKRKKIINDQNCFKLKN